MRRPFVCAASLQYLKACLAQGMGGEETDCCVVVYDKYPMIFGAHAGSSGNSRFCKGGYYYSPFLGSLNPSRRLNRIIDRREAPPPRLIARPI